MIDRQLFIDGHVHLYRPEDVEETLSMASRNFINCANAEGVAAHYGLLLLADPPALPGFEWITQRLSHEAASCETWEIVARSDRHVLHTRKANSLPIAIIAGRQITSSEGLEILIFPRTAAGDENSPIQKLVERAISENGLVILPWGVGKWFGRRGQLIDQILGDREHARVLVGDNGGRPRFWKRVRILDKARARGVFDIAGTDPLPGEWDRVGTFGIHVAAPVDHSWATTDFVDLLSEKGMRHFGQLASLSDFLKQQIAAQLRKKRS